MNKSCEETVVVHLQTLGDVLELLSAEIEFCKLEAWQELMNSSRYNVLPQRYELSSCSTLVSTSEADMLSNSTCFSTPRSDGANEYSNETPGIVNTHQTAQILLQAFLALL